MKVAKVSSVYEGKITNRSGGREGDEEAGRSRMARLDAQARRRNFRTSIAPRPLPGPRPRPRDIEERIIITRPMAASSLDKEKEKEEDQDVNMVKEKENGKEKVDEDVIIVEQEEEKTETAETEASTSTAAAAPTLPVGDGMFVGIDEWPMTWSYAEEWLWGGESLGLGLTNPHWEYISGVGWIEK